MLDAASSSATLVGRVAAHIRHAIGTRALAPGARLPSIRSLAGSQGVSKSTVVEAYDRLVADGAIRAKPGSGFYVAARPEPLSLTASGPRPDRAIDPLWVMRQALETGQGALRPGCGWLPESWLPLEAMRRALRAVARDEGVNLAGYGAPLGFLPLRRQLAARFAARGMEISPDHIVLTESGSHAIDLVCRLFVEPGDMVLVDDPCYFNFQAVLRAQRIRVLGVPYGSSGPDLAAFAQLAVEHRPRLYLTNSVLHNPTGASLAPATAHRLLKLAEAHDMIVVEDDIFADFEAGSAPRLAVLDGLARVVQIGSFSKTLSAAARCGFVATRPDWAERLVDLKLATSFSNGDLAAQLVHRLLTDGTYRRHVEALRVRLARAMGETARHLAEAGLTLWAEPAGGMFLWAGLPDGLDSAVIARRALEHDVVLAPGNVFSVSQTAARYLRFNVAQCGSPRVWEVLSRAMRG